MLPLCHTPPSLPRLLDGQGTAPINPLIANGISAQSLINHIQLMSGKRLLVLKGIKISNTISVLVLCSLYFTELKEEPGMLYKGLMITDRWKKRTDANNKIS